MSDLPDYVTQVAPSAAPSWVIGDVVTGPSAGATLVSKTISKDHKGWINGYFISTPEANVFEIQWTSGGAAKKIRIDLPSEGYIYLTDGTYLNAGIPADSETTVKIIVVNAGSSGAEYQAALLIMEEEVTT